MGYISWIGTYEGHLDPNKVHKVESQVVDELLLEGAVLYCKTSLSQTLFYRETVNNLIGQTLNPVNQGLSCGGSSWGEGALQALKGSLVGLGTDIGGSVRIPAAFCGKPTHDRLSYRHVANTNPGQVNYASSIGVMAISAAATKLMMTSLLSTKPWLRDPAVVPMPELGIESQARAIREGKITDKTPLKLGILFDDCFMTPHPPITRGLRMVHKALAEAGHKVVDWDPPSHREATQIHMLFLLSDGCYDIHKQLDVSGEPLIPPLREILKLAPPLSVIKVQELSVQGQRSCEAYTDYWNSMAGADGQDVDAFIMPVAPHAAVIPGRYLYDGYTEAINLLDYTVAVIPVNTADKTVDVVNPTYMPLNDLDAENWAGYDSEAYDGAPVGLQIVGRKYDEEKVWATAKIVDALLKNSHAPPLPAKT